MGVTRRFLGTSRPALTLAAEYLFKEYGGESLADFSQLLVVVPGRRAGRRLLEVLVNEAARLQVVLSPPRIETVGALPEHLYQPLRPFAGELTQQLAWAEAFRRLDSVALRPLIPFPPAHDEPMRWLELGGMLRRQHLELAADGIDFADVARKVGQLAGQREHDRWRVMVEVQQHYHQVLDTLQLWDRQTARLVAIDRQECATDREIILLGTVDMNIAMRRMIDQVADQVTALVFAPDDWEPRFDSHGCLQPEQWKQFRVDLPEGKVHVVDGPAEQADAVVRCLEQFDGQYSAEEITIGVPQETIVPDIERRLAEANLPVRWGPGRPLQQTPPLALLGVLSSFAATRSYTDFAACIRHPDLEAWLRGQGIAGDYLSQLDAYQGNHLPDRVVGDWLGNPERVNEIAPARELVAELVAPLLAAKSLAESGQSVLQILQTVYHREFDVTVAADQETLNVCRRVRDSVLEQANIPPQLLPTLTGPEAVSLLLQQLSGDGVPAPASESIEMLGWLELPLDDAPALIVTSFNEGFVPQSVNSDLFLPNALRGSLGLLDNDRRYARDCYALATILASRETVDLIVARRNQDGDPLIPSRLLFADDQRTAAKRALRFFRPPDDAGATAELQEESESSGWYTLPEPTPPYSIPEKLSVTAFRDYLQCPYRFYLKHILKLSAASDDEDEMDGGAFGTLAHDVLGWFGQCDQRDSEDPVEIRLVFDKLLNRAVERFFGKQVLPVVQVQVEQLRLRLHAFAEQQAEWRQQGWRIEHTEVPARNQSTAELDVDGVPMRLSGRIDRIDINEETDEWMILDYKTSDAGKDPEATHRDGGEWIDLQLPLYRHLARGLELPDQVQLGFVVLPKDADRVRFSLADWSEEELRSADDCAAEVVRQIRQGRFWPPEKLPSVFIDDFAPLIP